MRREYLQSIHSVLHSEDAFSTAYDFVFGWSNGGAGISSLSEAAVYGNPKDVMFLIESKNCPKKFENLKTQAWFHMTFNQEYEFVKQLYVPFLEKCRGGKKTLVDLGHHTLYFMDALIKYFEAETSYKFVVIRIRRSRFELAMSLTGLAPNRPRMAADLCGVLHYRFCPFDRTRRVINHPPSKAVWNRFSNFQKALWMIDEVEARWGKLRSQHPDMQFLEIFWAEFDGPNSLGSVAASIAKLVSLTANATLVFEKLHQHSDRKAAEMIVSRDLVKENDEYTIKMKENLFSRISCIGYGSLTIAMVCCCILVFIWKNSLSSSREYNPRRLRAKFSR